MTRFRLLFLRLVLCLLVACISSFLFMYAFALLVPEHVSISYETYKTCFIGSLLGVIGALNAKTTP